MLNRDVSSLYVGLSLSYVCSFAFNYLRVVSYLGLFGIKQTLIGQQSHGH